MIPAEQDSAVAATEQRLIRLSLCTDADLLFEAASIIENDPMLLNGSFYTRLSKPLLKATFAKFLTPYQVEALPEEAACHCLEGAVREAAGCYLSTVQDIITLREVEKAFNERKHSLNARLVTQFNRDSLVRVMELYGYRGDRETVPLELTYKALMTLPLEDVDRMVYSYSDGVLHQMGVAGPGEAARILRAAAADALAAENAS